MVREALHILLWIVVAFVLLCWFVQGCINVYRWAWNQQARDYIRRQERHRLRRGW